MLQTILSDAAAKHGDKVALVTASRSLSYRELDDLSSAFAGALRQRGIDDGDRVSIYSQNRWEWVVAYHGILKAGAVVNPINVMLTPEEVAFVLNDCGARAIVTSGDKAPAIVGLRDQATRLETVVTLRRHRRPGRSRSTASWRAARRSNRSVRPAPRVAVDDRLHVGNHRPPEGRDAVASGRVPELRARRRRCTSARPPTSSVTALPAPHVYGNVVINSTFMAGGTVVLMERFDPGRSVAAASPSTGPRCSRACRRCTR